MACEHDKLVRDKIPEIIEEDGKESVIYIADDDEYTERLVDKLEEEVEEFLKSREVDELADILEVIHAIREDRGITNEQLQKKREQKADSEVASMRALFSNKSKNKKATVAVWNIRSRAASPQIPRQKYTLVIIVRA